MAAPSIWNEGSSALHDMCVAAAPSQILIRAWYSAMLAAQVSWLALKEDPIKGRPNPASELAEMWVVSVALPAR